MPSGYDINELYREAQHRWLKPVEVLFILQNHENLEFAQELPHKPTSGTLLLYNKRVHRYFRKDGHDWRKKRDGRTVGEAHERLKVGNLEAINCYYAHGEHYPNFQRRSYWMLDPAYEHIVLVHYREVTEGRLSSVSISPGASSATAPSPVSYSTQNPGSSSGSGDLHGQYKNISSPGSVEVSSEVINGSVGINPLNGTDRAKNSCTSAEFGKALKRLEEQLSLNDDSFQEIEPLCCQDDNANDSRVLEYETKTVSQDQYVDSLNTLEYLAGDQYYAGMAGMQDNNKDHVTHKGEGGSSDHQTFIHDHTNGSNESLSWSSMLEPWKNATSVQQEEKTLLPSRISPFEERGGRNWLTVNGSSAGETSRPVPQVGNFGTPAYASAAGPHDTNMDYYTTFFDQGQMGMPLEEGPSLTISQNQKFNIREISPEWGYATEATKVIIIGSFLCDPSESAWTCMFGNTEVPIQIIQEGVIRCEAPPHSPGKVTFCITSGNRESCSQVREFEYRAMSSNGVHRDVTEAEATRSTEEMLLLVRFAQMLLTDSLEQTRDSIESGIHMLRRVKAGDDSWGHIIEALLVGAGTSSGTMEWLLQELLKDKLQQWLSSRSLGRHPDQLDCSLSKKEQGIIHMIAGLGFEWALNPILNCGVNINFRDINGWTALHWAARFGREKMVAALIASGAYAGAVTDPTSKDPNGKTPASVAAASGHKGLAGYLSEVALTSHLSSLRLEESELSRGSAEVHAEMTVNNISSAMLAHQSSIKDTLAAVRNAAQAAARIQSAFRAHSFRKRQQQEAVTAAAANSKAIDEYEFDVSHIQGFPEMSSLTFSSGRDYNSAAFSIQKKYKGWKGRRDFRALRQKVVKIQAHVRGYQVRKQYKVICWAVGILEKVVLRWRRKGAGLRGFRQETESIDESEDEDIAKLFRKQKVDAAIDDAVSRVLSVVDNSDARKQYRRMLERYREAKAELGVTGEAAASTSQGGVIDMDNEEYQFP